VDFDDLQAEKQFNAFHAFGASKACNLLFTYKLARRLASSHMTVNAIHPGLVKSHLMREAPAPLHWVTSLLSSKPEQAVETMVYYASSPNVQVMTGKFFKGRQAIDSSPYTKDQVIQQRLWEVSMALTHLE
jgi:NAD(P)-dependent dehydrogenase (short-subunit alcohol dehydrogenase family)